MGLSPSDFEILAQPDDLTCGPTCLQAVYAFYRDHVALPRVIAEVPQLVTGGTLSVLLGIHALRRGYRATLYSWDLELFDPTWFENDTDLRAKLIAQALVKPEVGLQVATDAYVSFLDLGGRLRYSALEPDLLRRFLREGTPILTGLSATYLYGCAREREAEDGTMVYDDIRGRSAGHFVVLWRYDRSTRLAWLADPLHDNPLSGSHVYAVPIQKLLSAILLGSTTFDANFLVLRRSAPEPSS